MCLFMFVLWRRQPYTFPFLKVFHPMVSCAVLYAQCILHAILCYLLCYPMLSSLLFHVYHVHVRVHVHGMYLDMYSACVRTLYRKP